jgi:pSer/pThr/pTyr-binding forkhead associated (FHA) protein
MSMLELGGRRFTIPMGEVVLGSDPQCAISLTGAGLLPRHALLSGQPDGQVVIRKATPDAEVMINGVRLGAEPTPLLHGDKLQVAGQELSFVDERRSGSTAFIPAMALPQGGEQRQQSGVKSAGTTGGRLVSLTDGREYQIMSAPLVMGREAGCDVVIPGKDVSRRHAEIVPSAKGYLIVDSSTNGVYVNDARVPGQRVLTRGDVIRVGEESFRFYADQAAAAAAPAATAAPAAPPPPPPPPAGAESRLQNTSFGMPATPRPGAATANPGGGGGSGAAPLANFLVRSGTLKGTRLLVRTPIVNIGRAEYNDLIIPDESVSTSHAKLQRREGHLRRRRPHPGRYADRPRHDGAVRRHSAGVRAYGRRSRGGQGWRDESDRVAQGPAEGSRQRVDSDRTAAAAAGAQAVTRARPEAGRRAQRATGQGRPGKTPRTSRWPGAAEEG